HHAWRHHPRRRHRVRGRAEGGSSPGGASRRGAHRSARPRSRSRGMSTLAAAAPTAAREERRSRLRVALLLGALGLILLSFVREVTSATDLTSSGTFAATLRVSMPILLAGLGGLYAERAGIVNIGLEGIMILGTWVVAW